MTAKSFFRQSDIKRALCGAREAGLCIKSLRIMPSGAIEIEISNDNEPEAVADNPWDLIDG